MSHQQLEIDYLELIKIDFTTLPLENQINILWYCDELTLTNFAQTNREYYHLILGVDDDDDKPTDQSNEVSAYRNTIWKVRLLAVMNQLIDECNKNIIERAVDTSLLNNFKENDLTRYVKNNLRLREDSRIKYSALLSCFKRINFQKSISGNDVESNGRELINKKVHTWYSFMNCNYPISISGENFSSHYCFFEGYEIVIDRYSVGANDWNIVFGIGAKYDEFGKSLSIAEFTIQNFGVGYIIQCNQFKIRGEHICDSSFQTFSRENIKQAKIGDRFSLKIDRSSQRLSIHFFKNGHHIVSVEGFERETLEPIICYPIISMCVEMGVTFYPLLQVDYPLIENTHIVQTTIK